MTDTVLNLSGDISQRDLRGVNLSGLVISGASFKNTDLSRSDLSNIELGGGDSPFADFSGAKFLEANLTGAHIYYADFFGADFSGAKLSYADLSSSNFSNTKFCDADFSGAKLSYANLSSADLTGSYMVNVRTDGIAVDENTKTHDIKLIHDVPQLPSDEKISKTKSALQGIDEKLRRLILRDNPALQ